MGNKLMGKIIELVREKWFGKAPANENTIAEVESQLAVTLPRDYVELLLWSNGGEAKIGSAYFQFWPIQNVQNRNVSASIYKYMTKKFIGIGTNGGGECYGLDYTKNNIPTFVIVPLGDLDPENKFVIASSLTEGIELASVGQFDDGEYNALPGKKPSDELINIKMKNIRVKADKAWQEKNFSHYVNILDAVQDHLTDVEKKKLGFARSKL